MYKQEIRDLPVSRRQAQAVIVEPTPVAETQSKWADIAQSVSALNNNSKYDANTDTPDDSDVQVAQVTPTPVAKVPVDNSGAPMVYDTKTDTWFPITVVLPGQNQPAPAAPAIPEAEKRKKLIAIFAISLLILLVILYFISRKK
jgi:hypothetical protein